VEPYEIAAANDYDPPPGDGGEYEEDVGLAFDDALGTYWQTEGYNTPDLGGIKEGVGIYFDLGGTSEVGRIRIRTPAPGWRFQVRGSDDGQTFGSALPGEDGNKSFVARHSGDDPLVVNIEPSSHQYFLIWIVALPEEVSPHRVQITEVDFFPPRD
jgi:hypothetical protein